MGIGCYQNQNTCYYANNFTSTLKNTPAITFILYGSGTENYAISCGAVRIGSTDVNSETCGFHPNAPQQDGNDLVIQIPVTYQIANHITQSAGSDTSVILLTTVTDCEGAPDPDYYKTTEATAVAANMTKVYPTILEGGNNTVTLKTNIDTNSSISIYVSSIEGRRIDTKRIASGQIMALYHILYLFLPGVYLLRLSNNKGNLNETFKIYKQ